MATAFHYFPYLPWELRALVWELSAEPRVVRVRTVECGKRLSDASAGKEYFSITPVPAMLQACRESRNIGVYRRCFSEVQRIPESVPKTTRIRYVWLNLDLDMIDIGERELRDLKFVAPTIKRLQIKLGRDEFGYSDATALYDLESLDEVHIVCPSERILQRSGCVLMSFYHGHLDKNRIILIDKTNDQTTTLFEWNREAEKRFGPHQEEFEAGYKDYTSLSSNDIKCRISWAHIYYAMGGYIRRRRR